MPQKIMSKTDHLFYLQETLSKAETSITAIKNGGEFEVLLKKDLSPIGNSGDAEPFIPDQAHHSKGILNRQ